MDVGAANRDGTREAGESRFLWFRWWVVATQAATILITWPLWQHRVSPPPLPLLEGLPYDFGPVLLLSLLVVLVQAELGAIVHSVLLLAAMLCDQMRLQPEFISQAILLWGTLRWPAARTLCRAHLIALWFFAGFHKLFSPEYLSGDARWLVTSFVPDASGALVGAAGLGIGLTEVAMAALAVVPAWRTPAAWLVCAVHSAINATLALGLGWDEAVWPWNAALAMTGFVMLSGWTESPWSAVIRHGAPVRAAVACLLLAPLGYYPGWVEPYLCHLLYSSHVPLAWIRSPDGQSRLVDTRPELCVPVPQVHRLYERYFAKVAEPGDVLEIHDPRVWYRWSGKADCVIPFADPSSPPTAVSQTPTSDVASPSAWR